MIIKKLMRSMFLVVAVGALFLVVILSGCTSNNESSEGPESGSDGTSQESAGGESGGEHSSGGESSSEGSESGSEEGSGANQLAPDETFDTVRSGARLILNYDAGSNAFTGTVENTTNNTLTRVRIEVHLDNGTELGPTTPVDLAPGQVLPVNLPSTVEPFTGWTPHAEVGSGEGGGESGGSEGGNEGPEGTESGGTGAEAGEAEMSSPIIPLIDTWAGNLGGLDVVARYDPATQSVQSLVTNTLPQVLCYVQAEPHLKSGTTTVGELGPDVLGHLSPGQSAATSVPLASEPSLAGVSFDGYVVHLEVFDCGGTGPVPHMPGQSTEGSGGEHGSGEGGGGEGSGGEGHGPGGEGGRG